AESRSPFPGAAGAEGAPGLPIVSLLVTAPIGDDFALDRVAAQNAAVAREDFLSIPLTENFKAHFAAFDGEVRNRRLGAGPQPGDAGQLAVGLFQFQFWRHLAADGHGESPLPNAG